MLKLLNNLITAVMPILLVGCAASLNGVGVDMTGQAYFSPHAPSSDDVAVVYIYWNQPDAEQYFPSYKKPSWTTRVNGKTNAKLELGSYSVVEVNPGKVKVDARLALGTNLDNMSDRSPSTSLTAEAGEVYFVKATLDQGSLGLELRLDREFSERDAYNYLYGTKYQPNRQESLIY